MLTDTLSRRRCECSECFYCGTPLAIRHEHDHFPVPKIAGGTSTVPACLNCHDLKDRDGLNNWPASAFGAFLDLPPRAVRVFLNESPTVLRQLTSGPNALEVTDYLNQLVEGVPESTSIEDVLREDWAGMSTQARLFLAKVIAMEATWRAFRKHQLAHTFRRGSG